MNKDHEEAYEAFLKFQAEKQAKEAHERAMQNSLNQAMVGAGTFGPGNYPGLHPIPTEPALLTKAAECVGYVAELEDSVATLRESLFGDGQNRAVGNEKAPHMSLAVRLADLSQRLASLVGQMKTVNRQVETQPVQYGANQQSA